MRIRFLKWLVFPVLCGLAVLAATADAAPGITTRVSVASDGTEANGSSAHAIISANGRYVAFDSPATNLVSGDTNGNTDVFVHDLQTGQTTRVSVDSSGNQANAGSTVNSISADGRYVVFSSTANNLVLGDDNGCAYVSPSCNDVFVRDRQTGQTERISVDSAGNQGNGDSWGGPISADGRYVAFLSDASNLVAGDTNNFCGVSHDNCVDVFVHDRQTGQTTRVSVDTAGNQANSGSGSPSISGDGRYVAFASGASNLVADDTNGVPDIFVHDLQTGQTTRVSVDSAGNQADSQTGYYGSTGDPRISADGTYIAFDSYATNLVPGDTNGDEDVFVHDRQTGQTTRVSVDSAGVQENRASLEPTISADGRYVSFWSDSTNLVSGDTNGTFDVFVHDLQTAQTTRVSVDSAGNQADNVSRSPSISADGRYVAFASEAGLVPGDTNGCFDCYDIFVHDGGPQYLMSNFQQCGTPTPPWAPTPYDSLPGATICSSGCAMTSAADVLTYYGVDTDPGRLNTCLTNFQTCTSGKYPKLVGYKGGDVNWDAVACYATYAGVTLRADPPKYPKDGSTVNQELSANVPNGPVIAGVWNKYGGSPHFVTVVQAAGDDWWINDPLGKTKLSDYNDSGGNSTVDELVFLHPDTACTGPKVIVRGHSPIEYIVTDPAGRRLG
ncbi:MAG: hypothetical protein ABSG55_04420, partial [Dehalococcoidia bacterium]